MNRRASSKRGHRLNVLVAGSAGCGKSTLVNTLCQSEVADPEAWRDAPVPTQLEEKKLSLKTYTKDLVDPELGNITLRLVEANGLGENLNDTQVIADLVRYIEGQYDEVLAEESRIKRNPRFLDNRVHALVYMIEATGHGLRESDVRVMRAVSAVVNVIPVLAKADALTPAEVLANKRLVAEDLQFYDIPVFQFAGPDELEEPSPEARKLQDALPFAIVASSKTVKLAGDSVALVREYPWGLLHVEDPKVSDFAALRTILLYSHINELREVTTDILYEQYRTQRLSNEPEFNAARAAASAPTTASHANLAGAAKGEPLPRVQPAFDSPYLVREDQLRAEEELLMADEQKAQTELELRREELRARERELQALEARLRAERERSAGPQ